MLKQHISFRYRADNGRKYPKIMAVMNMDIMYLNVSLYRKVVRLQINEDQYNSIQILMFNKYNCVK